MKDKIYTGKLRFSEKNFEGTIKVSLYLIYPFLPHWFSFYFKCFTTNRTSYVLKSKLDKDTGLSVLSPWSPWTYRKYNREFSGKYIVWHVSSRPLKLETVLKVLSNLKEHGYERVLNPKKLRAKVIAMSI